MELNEIFNKWKLNHNLFASLLDIPKGTFNNKLNPNGRGAFSECDQVELKKIFKAMSKDLKTYADTYTMPDEDLTGSVDEVITYNGKPV